MAKPFSYITSSISILFLTLSTSYADIPEIIGKPTIDKPQLLEWPLDRPIIDPTEYLKTDLSEPTANNINDLHANISKCDDINVILSTAGNYHMALYMVRTFPDKFDIIPLGGTVDNPEPVAGNKQATLFIATIKGELTTEQYMARDALIEAYQSSEFKDILIKHGLLRP